MLHFKSLEHFALALKNEDSNPGLIQLSPTTPCVLVLTNCMENFLSLQDLPLTIDLLYEAHLVELGAPLPKFAQ